MMPALLLGFVPPFEVLPPPISCPAELRILPIPFTVVPSLEVMVTVSLLSFVT